MKIISGKFKGRNIIIPNNQARPTLDRAKETLFNILQFDLEGVRVLDLFAGSGSLGFEALSRGAIQTVFVDQDSISIEAVKQNAQRFVCLDEISVIKSDYQTALAMLDGKFDIVFIDPPYMCDYYVNALQLLCKYNLLSPQAIIVCESSLKTILPTSVDILHQYRIKKVGTINFTFYKLGV
ncbi:MAG: 16S rRNA (guanine(966)-N(2))-methyltransferase RsmD [Clostridia bacterium]